MNHLKKEFPIHDMGDLHYFLCLEVIRNNDGILVAQNKYVGDLL